MPRQDKGTVNRATEPCPSSRRAYRRASVSAKKRFVVLTWAFLLSESAYYMRYARSSVTMRRLATENCLFTNEPA